MLLLSQVVMYLLADLIASATLCCLCSCCVQAQAEASGSVEVLASTPHIASLSIPRSLSLSGSSAAAAIQLLQGHQQQYHEGDDLASLQAASSSSWQLQPQHENSSGLVNLRPTSSSGGGSVRVPEALQFDGGAAEQFLQLLQQELNKVSG